MVALGYTLAGIANILNSVLWFFLILVIARVIISWVNADPYNFLVRVIVQSTDPLFNLFRRWPLQFGGLDLTPLVLMLVIEFLRFVLVNTISFYAGQILRAAGV